MTTRIVLVDDHQMVREGLRELLNAEWDLQVVAEAGDGREAIAAVLEMHPDVVVMDLELPELDGASAMQFLHEQDHELHIVALGSQDDDRLAVAALRAGAIGYLGKSASSDSLVHAVRAAARGQISFSASATSLLVEELQRPADQPERLTVRELEVLAGITDGLSNKEIAWKLRISEKTVKSHVSTILGKFGLESRTQAAMHATRVGLVAAGSCMASVAPRTPGRAVVPLDSRRTRMLPRAVAS
jgi:DNA-binding NarL/FixJ family response regulator